MDDYIVVVGYDTWTEAVIDILRSAGVSHVVILTDKTASTQLQEKGTETITVPEFSEAAFREAETERATAVLVATLNDQRNVLAVLTAAEVSEETTIVSFVSENRDSRKLQRAGADVIVNLGQVMAELIADTAITGRDPDNLLMELLSKETTVELTEDASVAQRELEETETPVTDVDVEHARDPSQ